MGQAGNAAQGAAGGAMTGAAIGSVVPGIGTAVGAVGGGILGGLGGWFGSGGNSAGLSPEQQAMYDQYISQMGGRDVQSDFRNDQRFLVDQLRAQASGQGPSLATQQLNKGADMIGRQQQTIANAARGSSAGLARFQAQNNASTAFSQANQDAAAARIAEQMGARQQLGQVAYGARGQDIEQQLRLMGLNDAAIAQYMQTGAGRQATPSMGEQILAGGGQAASMAFGRGRGGGNIQQAASPYAYNGAGAQGNNTLNPFEQGFAPARQTR